MTEMTDDTENTKNVCHLSVVLGPDNNSRVGDILF